MVSSSISKTSIYVKNLSKLIKKYGFYFKTEGSWKKAVILDLFRKYLSNFCVLRIQFFTKVHINIINLDHISITNWEYHLKVAHPRGFEPLAFWTAIRCSIQLSYGCNFLWLYVLWGNVNNYCFQLAFISIRSQLELNY